MRTSRRDLTTWPDGSPNISVSRVPRARVDAGIEKRVGRASSAVVQDAVVPVLLRGALEAPEDRELVSALLALVVLVEVPAGDVESVPLDRDRAAPGAIRVLERMARDVPDVDVLQTFLLRDRAVLLERLDGRPGELHHLVVRVESQEVDRRVVSAVGVHLLRQFPGGVERVDDFRVAKVRDLAVTLLVV